MNKESGEIRLWKRIRRIGKRLCGKTLDVDGIIGDVFVECLVNFRKGKIPPNILLTKMLMRRCGRERRRKKVEKEVSKEDLAWDSTEKDLLERDLLNQLFQEGHLLQGEKSALYKKFYLLKPLSLQEESLVKSGISKLKRVPLDEIR